MSRVRVNSICHTSRCTSPPMTGSESMRCSSKRPEPESRQSPTMVYFHGNSGNVGHRLPHVVDLYHHCRCNLLLVEYRGFGLSGGYPSEKGLCLDARAGLDYVLQRPDLDSNKIIVFGRSLGGAVSIDLVANSPNRSRIAALVVENTFTTLPNIAPQTVPCVEITSRLDIQESVPLHRESEENHNTGALRVGSERRNGSAANDDRPLQPVRQCSQTVVAIRGRKS